MRVVAPHPLDQFGVALARAPPELQVPQGIARNHLHILVHLPGVRLVDIDTLDRRGAHPVPVGLLEARTRRQRDALEIREVGFEAVQDGAHEALLHLHRVRLRYTHVGTPRQISRKAGTHWRARGPIANKVTGFPGRTARVSRDWWH